MRINNFDFYNDHNKKIRLYKKQKSNSNLEIINGNS